MYLKYLTLLTFLNFYFVGYSQTNNSITNKSFDKSLLKSDKYLMDCFIQEENPKTKFATFSIDIDVNDKTITVNTKLNYDRSNEAITDKTVADINSLKPIYRSTFSKTYDYELNFNNGVEGYYLDKKNQKKITVNDKIASQTIDNFLYTYLLGSLPLSEKFKGNLSTYDYNNPDKNKTADVIIQKVTSTNLPNYDFKENMVWQVDVLETAVNDNYHFFIDKNTRKIARIEVETKGQKMILVTKAVEFGGTTISGKVFARDNQNDGMLKGMAVLNINKKQYAPIGTNVYLIPATTYYETFKENAKTYKKQKKSAPVLSNEFVNTIRTTSVQDEKGFYEFKNIAPGDYYLLVTFGYDHTHIGTEVVGQVDVFVNDNYQGSRPITQIYSEGQNATAYIEKKIKVEKNSKTLTKDLKKTL